MNNLINKLNSFAKREWFILTGKIIPTEDDYHKATKFLFLCAPINALILVILASLAMKFQINEWWTFPTIFFVVLPSYLFYMKHWPPD